VYWGDVRHRTKFHGGRLNICSGLTIFFNFENGNRPPFWSSYTLIYTNREKHLVVFITVQNMVGIDSMQVQIFCEFGLKCLFTPQTCFKVDLTS